jgi:hypothetical protein
VNGKNEGNQIHNFIFSSGSGTVNNYCFDSDFLTSSGSGSASQKVTVPTVPVPQHWCGGTLFINNPGERIGEHIVADKGRVQHQVHQFLFFRSRSLYFRPQTLAQTCSNTVHNYRTRHALHFGLHPVLIMIRSEMSIIIITHSKLCFSNVKTCNNGILTVFK